MTTAPPWRATSRRASRRVRTNDAEILAASVSVLADHGWGGFSAAAVARASNLSKRAVSTRYRSRAALAADTWQQRCEPALRAVWTDVTSAHGDALVEVLTRLTTPSREQLAGLELLLIASYDPDLAAATRGFRSWIGEQRDGVTPAIAARQTYAVALALGLVCAAHDPIVQPEQTRHELTRVAAALEVDREPQPLPDIPALHLRGTPPIDTGDEITDALLSSALDLITEEGFDGVSVIRICERAGVSEGALFNRYPSKIALLKDAVAIAHREGFALNNDFVARVADEHGPGIAEAVMLCHILNPQTRLPVIMNLEQTRVSWHYPELATALRVERDAAIDASHAAPEKLAFYHLGLATGYGFMLMNLLDPGAWTLPFDVVSVPLEGEARPTPPSTT